MGKSIILDWIHMSEKWRLSMRTTTFFLIKKSEG